MTDRYDTTANPEGQFQPGSNDLVLLNKLGVADSTEMNDEEFLEMRRTLMAHKIRDCYLKL